MTENQNAGYRDLALDWLKKQKLEVWDEVEIVRNGSSLRGVILPRGELVDPNFISLKLSTGYNIGFNIEGIQNVKKISHIRGEYRIPKTDFIQNNRLPFIPIIGCGGTIASRLDYQTGGTIPALTPEELLSSFPEIAELAQIETSLLFDVLSENISFEHYSKILTEIESQFKSKKPNGIVLTHGTDTMAFTAAALSFAILNPPFPIVLTGSQRSSDRPSSDSFLNLYNSVLYAASPHAMKKVVVIMHENSSNTSCAIHLGTRVRKMHSSRRNAFKTIGTEPLGRIVDGEIEYSNYKETQLDNSSFKDNRVEIKKKFEDKVGLIYHYPGIKSGVLDHYIEAGYKGIVFAGTGLGHVSSNLIPLIEKATENGIITVMTTQCIYGYTSLSVYESGRRLQRAGIVPVFNMLPEVAYVKLAFLLGNYSETKKIKELMKQNLKGEILTREKFHEFQ
jgi:glutamyl-tRNA(Gln) amidotransferase subunit D